MNVTEQCLICQTNNLCDCRQSLASFFNILKSANNRVLRVKPSSDNDQPKVIGAGIDKLNAYFTETIQIGQIHKAAKLFGYTIKRVFLKDRKPYLVISSDSNQIHLKLSYGETDITGLISNPNKFINWQNYYTFINSVVPKEPILNAKVTRLDLNLDFECSFSALTQMLDIKNKRSSLTFIDESGSRTGLIIGKGNEKIEIYDKAKKENLTDNFTRIELRLGKSKLPSRSIIDIPNMVAAGLHFEGLVGVNTRFTDLPLNTEQSLRLAAFKHNLERDGFYSAKKMMNQSRNFDRDFSKLIKVDNWKIQPSQLFKTKIETFIKPQGVKTWMH
ncbi:MAG: hypothetical protein H7328_07540 [Bdellovibrio sp.]|nr:hypothetical protein [Bdellovibrio sp.]